MTYTIDRKAFFDRVRKAPFEGRLSSSQVAGMEAILNVAELRQTRLDFLAYMLATTFHETARSMEPIEEFGRGRGKAYGVPNPKTGKTYFGRGYVQLTWLENYQKAKDKIGVDFVNHPDLVMQPAYAAEIMFTGMEEGWFTSRKLSDYARGVPFNALGARRIINGRNKKRFEQGLDADADYDRAIAGYYRDFYTALTEAHQTAQADQASQTPILIPENEPDLPDLPPAAPPSSLQIFLQIFLNFFFGAHK